MRRIIERVITVVTTTTWKISWEAESPPPDSDSIELPNPHASQGTPIEPTTGNAKEVDGSKNSHETNRKSAGK
jgi:hypothetical protein